MNARVKKSLNVLHINLQPHYKYISNGLFSLFFLQEENQLSATPSPTSEEPASPESTSGSDDDHAQPVVRNIPMRGRSRGKGRGRKTTSQATRT